MITTRQLEDSDLAYFHERATAEADAFVRLLTFQRMHARHQPQYAQIVFDDAKPCGYLLARHTRLRYGVATLDCGDLTIFPIDLGLEYATALSEAVLPALQAADVSLLRVRANLGQYATLGFAACQYQTRFTIPRSIAAQGHLRQAEHFDREDLAALYQAGYHFIALSELHSPADWHDLSDYWVLAEPSGRLSGFVRYTEQHITEAAAADAGAARALWGAVSRELLEASECFLPVDHLVAQTALALGSEVRIRAYGADQLAPLFGILDTTSLLRQLLPQLQDHFAASHYADWSGTMQFEIADELVLLAIERGTLRLGTGSTPDAVRLRRLTLGGMVQLLLGYRRAADLRATGELVCDDAALGLVDALLR